MRSYRHISSEQCNEMAAEAADILQVLEKQDAWRAKHLRDQNAVAFIAMLERINDRIGSLFALERREALLDLLARKAGWFLEPFQRCRLGEPLDILDMQLTAISSGKWELEKPWRRMIEAQKEIAAPDYAIDLSRACDALADGRHSDALFHISRLEAIWGERSTDMYTGKSAITLAKCLVAIHNHNAPALSVALGFRERFLGNWLREYADVHRPAQLFDVATQAVLVLARRRGMDVAQMGIQFADADCLP